MFNESNKCNIESLDKRNKKMTTLIDTSSNLIKSLPQTKMVLTSSKWSSNIRQNSHENDDINVKFDHKLTKQLSVDSNEFKNSLKVNDSDRPVTSISLPSKVNSDKKIINKPKNTSFRATPATPKRIIVRSQSPASREESIQSEIDSEDTNLDLNPISIVINSPATKSNLDYFINLASNPFTTKYEMIGPCNSISKSLSPPMSHNNNDSNKYLSDIKVPIRSNSAFNINTSKGDELKTDYVNVDFDLDHKLAKSVSDENLNNEYISNSNRNFFKITDRIFTGNKSCIKNERKMCKLNIEYLIDMTHMRPEDLNRQLLGKLPCLCKSPHSRITLTVELTDKSFKTLFITFSEVNKLIQRAKKANKCILIYGKECLSQQVVCACAQYLMVDCQMNMLSALNSIVRKDFNLNYFDKAYFAYLEQLEAYLKHISTTDINLNFNCMSTKTNKLNKAKIVYRPLNNEDEFGDIDEKNSNVRIDYKLNIDRTNLDYCNISDEEDTIQFNGKKKYTTRQLLSDSEYRFNSNKKSVSFSKLKNSANSHTETNASGSKLAWM